MSKNYTYAKLAQLAYCNPGESNDSAFDRAKFMESDNAEAWMFFTPEATVISCRGTEPSQLKDITADLKFWRIDPAGTGEKIHSGFWSEAFSLFPKVIKNLPDDEKPIVLTGHSLGGAMAVIMTGFLLKSGYNVKELYPEVVKELEDLAEVARNDLGDDLNNRIGNNIRESGTIE